MRVVVTSATTTAIALLNGARGRREFDRVVLRPGDVAPDFTLTASDGRTYRLANFRGQMVVIAWFPKAFTGGCAIQCKSIGEHCRRLRDMGVAIFGANVDTVETNRAFAAAVGFDMPVLSDPSKGTARAYGVIGASGFPSRSTFYIGADGRILSIDTDVRVRSNGLDIEDTLRQLLGRKTAGDEGPPRRGIPRGLRSVLTSWQVRQAGAIQ